MADFFCNTPVQYGALGLCFILVSALLKAFFSLLQQRQKMQEELFEHHTRREKAFTEQFLATIDRNSAALEKVEYGLTRLQIELARQKGTVYVEYEE